MALMQQFILMNLNLQLLNKMADIYIPAFFLYKIIYNHTTFNKL